MIPHPTPQARYIMLGGFLGAGKTTAVAALAEHLTAQGLRVGLITNDQGSELVDTAMLRSKGFRTEEIAGGCFCCRFTSLMEAADRLNVAGRPDVFIAEPVGSCTDLVATVTYPLRRIYGDQFTVAPLSVLVDPVRAERVLGISEGGRFSDKVVYIYRKQLEEADLIVISKADSVSPSRIEALQERLTADFPHASVLAASIRAGTGLAAWWECVLGGEQVARETMEVDYKMYAEGEALLGWLNATVQVAGEAPFDSEVLLKGFANSIRERLAGTEIAHLKMTLSPDGGLPGVAVVNLVRSDFVPELSLALEELVGSGQIIVNLRAEAAPERLREALEAAVAGLPVRGSVEHLEFFRPGKPVPTHRDVVGAVM